MDNMHAQMSRNLVREKYENGEIQLQGGEALNFTTVLISNDAKWIFVCCGRCVEVYSYSSHQVVSTLRHDADVTAVLLNPKNFLQLFSASLDGKLRVWDFTDGALLKTIDFESPLLKFGIRPGNEEPSLFFMTQRTEVVLVGLSRHVTTERNPATPPNEQLRDAQQFITMAKPNLAGFKFTYQGVHLVTCSGSGKRLVIYDLEDDNKFRYKCKYGVTTLACHPSRLCIATGNSRGEIQLWYDFAKTGVDEVVTTLHWHAHTVADLCFTTDGTYLLSGGEEGVLVLWQLRTNHKQFRPRLGSAITKISCSPGDSYFTVSLHSNVIQLVSGLNSEVEGVLGGLKKALTSNPGENGMKTGLVLCPHSTSLVLNSSPGLLQFYNTERSTTIKELDVVGMNYVSRVDQEPLILTTVDNVAFSSAGDWMITVESRDDGKTSPELRMKFWKFATSQQRYIQNTCVDPPHNQRVTSLTFQPTAESMSADRCELTPAAAEGVESSRPVLLAVTTSLDKRFKMWISVDNEEEEEEEEKKKEKEKGGEEKPRRGKRTVATWACRSVGYYHNLPCMDSAFSQDGSLLALNFDKIISVWDPYSCELRQTFSSPHKDETFKQVRYGQHECSQYLLASSSKNLHVWDLLSCKLLWRVAVDVSYLVVDPFSYVAAAFTQSDEDNKETTVYLFDPSSPAPLTIHSCSSSEPIVGAAFVPQTWDRKKLRKLSIGERSILYFMDKSQILYALETNDSSDDLGDRSKRLAPKMELDQENEAKKTFMEIFGQRKRLNGVFSSSHTSSSSRLVPSSSLFNAPPHVLPPPSSLCAPFMKRLLPPPTNINRTDNEENSDSTDDDTRELALSSSEEEETRVKNKKDPPRARDTKRTCRDSSSASQVKVQTDRMKVGRYDWLIDYFKSDT